MTYKISFPADFKNIPPLRHLVVSAALLSGFSQQKADHLQSILDEICSNAIEYGSQPTSEVLLEIFVDEQNFKVVCSDLGHGNRLNAESIEKKIQEELSPGSARGRGLRQIVKGFASELSIRDRNGGGIIVTALLRKSD